MLANAGKHKVLLFERDAAIGSRHQGLVIGLRQEAITILKSLNIPIQDLFSQHSARSLCLLGKNSNSPLMFIPRIFDMDLGDGVVKSGLVDRAALRQALISSLDQSCVFYDKKLVRYEADSDKVTAYFEDGTQYSGDFLVGADGARSAVRSSYCPALIPSTLPFWNNGGTFQLGPDTEKTLEGNQLLLHSRTALVRKSGQNGCSWLSFVYESQGKYSILWSSSMPTEIADSFHLTDELPLPELQQHYVRLAKEYIDADAAAIISATPTEKLFPSYTLTSVLPELLKTNPLEGVSTYRVALIGDAAHKTTTQAGMGATAALQDAQALFEVLRADEFGETELKKYNEELLARAKKVVGASYGNTMRIHERNATVIYLSTTFMWLVGRAINFASLFRRSG
ncbi:hypothetical protein HDU91_004710 [Kappamyces sp. JEL0680]|nr:hypothetical protein HDU91_004710 [Kappamyces sp. JEL0680]